MSLCRNRFRLALDAIATTLFPSRCLVCQQPLIPGAVTSQSADKEQTAGPLNAICDNCRPTAEQDIAVSLQSYKNCACCGYYLGDNHLKTSRCVPCSLSPLGVNRLFSRWWYLNPVEVLIHSFKYKPELALANYLGFELSETISEARKQLPELNWDLVLAVPSTITAMRNREFHHTGELASVVGRNLGLPVDRVALRMFGKELPQAKLKTVERMANISGKIAVSAERVRGKRILLVDDVVTSGSTLTEVAKVLKNAQVVSIDAFTLARSVRFQEQRLTVFAADRQDRDSSIDVH